MSKFFEVKVKYQSISDEGKVKNVSESYILDSLSFTETEANINKELAPLIDGEFDVMAIKVSNISEIVTAEDCDSFYKCKITFIAVDELSGTERKRSQNVLFQANTVEDAYKKANEWMLDVFQNYTIDSVVNSQIVDYFKYQNTEK